MSEERTFECWTVVDGKQILSFGEDRDGAIDSYLRDCNWRTKDNPWEWHVEKYGVRVVRLECREVVE